MKKITYNPSVAASILLAAVLHDVYQQAELVVTDKKGTDVAQKLTEAGVSLGSTAYVLLQDEKSEMGTFLGLGIVADHHELAFESRHYLYKLFKGDDIKLRELIEKGRVINNFLDSPAFKTLVSKVELETQDDDIEDDEDTDPVDENSDNPPAGDESEPGAPQE